MNSQNKLSPNVTLHSDIDELFGGCSIDFKFNLSKVEVEKKEVHCKTKKSNAIELF